MAYLRPSRDVLASTPPAELAAQLAPDGPCERTIRRWCAELGLVPVRRPPRGRRPRVSLSLSRAEVEAIEAARQPGEQRSATLIRLAGLRRSA